MFFSPSYQNFGLVLMLFVDKNFQMLFYKTPEEKVHDEARTWSSQNK